jgi:hypothetical protein
MAAIWLVMNFKVLGLFNKAFVVYSMCKLNTHSFGDFVKDKFRKDHEMVIMPGGWL